MNDLKSLSFDSLLAPKTKDGLMATLREIKLELANFRSHLDRIEAECEAEMACKLGQ